MSSPTVSVVIPCFNQGRFLGEALESVLAQTHPAAEIVVVDDGSTDDTVTVARRYPTVRCVQQRNMGLASARNTGLRHTAGDCLVLLDADDRLRPDALETGVRELRLHPECALVWGRCVRIDEHGRQLPTVPPAPVEGDAYEALLRTNLIWTPAVAMFRRSMCAPLMQFNPAVEAAADYDVYLRIAREFPIHGHTAVVAEYRLHGASMSRNTSRMLTSTMEVLRSQRRHLGLRQAYERAYEQGRRSWQGLYGEQMITQIREQVRNPRRWTQVGVMIAVLVRYYPRGLAAHLARTLLHWRDRSPGRPGGTARRTRSAAPTGEREAGSRTPTR